MSRRTVTILGSTGSIGVNTLNVVREHASSFRIKGLAAGSNTALLRSQIEEFRPEAVYLKDAALVADVREACGKSTKIFTESEGMRAFASTLDSDILVAATTGTGSLVPVMDALEKGRRVALANKEILVMAGSLVLSKLAAHPAASLVPVDSEHSAIFQCLGGQADDRVKRLILTGSGGPLREVSRDQFGSLSKEIVINHPKWKMGKKISVDSATLMNKGLEIIEAACLFNIPVDRIDVLIHPEAVIHSMVEFVDGSVIAQLGVTDMRLPIQYALSHPDRLPVSEGLRLDFRTHSSLTFAEPDRGKFPCLGIAYEAARRSGSAPCVLSAADEVAVGAYLEDRIGFVEIPRVIEQTLSRHRHVPNPGLSEIQSIHSWAIEEARRLC